MHHWHLHSREAEGQRHRRLPVSRAALAAAFLAALAITAPACGGASSDGGVSEPAAPGDDAGSSSGDPAVSPDGAVAIGADGGPVVTGPDTVSIIVEPTDKAAALLAAIQAAKTSVHMTMYLLNDTRFINALIAQHTAGHDLKVLLNKTFPGGAGTNTKAFNALRAGGVSVAWAPSTFTLTHEKTVIIDGTSAWIMTMNLETTSSQNREFLALDTQAADVAEAEAIFAADFANTAITPTGALVVAPTNARDKLVQLIQSAKTSVDVEAEELGDYKIVNALTAAVKAGAKVRVVLSDNPPSAAQSTAVAQLKAGGVQLVSVGTPYIHAKALVADGARAYVGSENFTTASLQYNRELGLITANAAAAAKVTQIIAQDFAAGAPL
jgi:phosphatidylserine/phosphatidylglycerophosphate/cardiolipin synthase-like enzyme